MSSDSVLIDVNGAKLVGIVHLPDSGSFEKAVVLMHGGPGGSKEGPSDLFIKLGNALSSSGMAAVRFDFLGSGESEGDYVNETPSSHVEQYRHITNWLIDQGCKRLGVVGESFGGTCALGGYDQQVNALVLLWPCIWLLDESFASLVTPAHLKELEEQGWIDAEGQHIGRAFVDELFANDNRESQLRTVISPTLLIHGDKDKEVPVHQSIQAYEILPEPKQLIIVPEGDHCLRQDHEQSLVIEQTVNWMIQYLN